MEELLKITLGDREMIEQNAEIMIKFLGRYNGGLIAKDYPQLDVIGVKEEWAKWARDVFVEKGKYT